MLTSLIVSTLLSVSPANAQQTPPSTGAPPPAAGSPAPAPGKPPAMMPLPPVPTDTKITGNECADEAKKAACKTTTLSTDLLQCMMGFKRQHKEFSVSPTCRVAIQKWHMAQHK